MKSLTLRVHFDNVLQSFRIGFQNGLGPIIILLGALFLEGRERGAIPPQ